MWTFGADSPSDCLRMMREFTLEDLAGEITCPMLVLDSENDAMAGGEALALYDSLRCPKDYLLFTSELGADQHCQMGAAFISAETILCWLDSVLGRTR
jgi:hypothetical protein